MDGKIRYVALQTSGQGVQLQGKTLYAENGVLVLNNAESAELDALIESGKRPDIAQAFRKIDEEEAERIVKRLLEKTPAQGHQGTYNSQVAPERNAQQKNFENTKAALTGLDEKVVEQSVTDTPEIVAEQPETIPSVTLKPNPLAALASQK